MNWSLLSHSLLISSLVAVLAGVLGFSTALALACVPPAWRRLLLGAALVALALPPFLITNTWLDLLGQQGLLRPWIPVSIYSTGGAVWLLTLLYWPITALFTLGAWARLELAQLEADPALRGGALVRCLLWPMARVSVGYAAVLTFVLALNNFSVPVILQVPVFAEELWLAFTTRLNDAGAWAAAGPLVAAPLALLLLLRRAEIAWPRLQGSAPSRALRRQLGPVWSRLALLGALVLILLSTGLPLTQLAARARTWAELPNLFRAAPDVIWNSFAYAAAAATLAMAAGQLGARFRVGRSAWLLFFVPGILLGRMLIAALNGTVIYGTSTLVILAFALRYLAIAWEGAASARRAMDRDLTDAARLGGARGWALFRHVHWPQIAPSLCAAWYVIYLLCLWDVETLVLIQPPGGETLALRVFNLLHYGHHAQANALCLTLLALALAPLGVWSILRRCFRSS